MKETDDASHEIYLTNMHFTLHPVFTLIRHASASYYVNSTTPVPKLSPTF